MSQVQFPLLSTDRYLLAKENAVKTIRNHAEAPVLADFTTINVSKFPAWFTWGTIGALSVVMISSFFVSSGKQVAAFGLVFDNLPDKFNHLSSGWANLSIIFMLLMSEIGAALFLVASGTLGEMAPSIKMWGRSFNVTKWTFRLFAILCASYAIASNVSVTLIDPVNSVSFVQWLASIGIPLTVLALSMILEQIVIDYLRTSSARKIAFETAQRDYQALMAHPERHEAYQKILADAIWAELCRLKGTRDVVEPLAESDPRYRRWIVVSEYRAQAEVSDFSLTEGDIPTGFLSETGESDSPALLTS